MSVSLGPIRPPSQVVDQVAAIKGPVSVFVWFEGTRGLPTEGAQFMKREIFAPLCSKKRDVKLCLYSLRGWDFCQTAKSRSASTLLQRKINKLNRTAVECFTADAFFQYCRTVKEPLASYVRTEWSKKQWLFDLSAGAKETGKTVGALFQGQKTVFDWMQNLDLPKAYSAMQYFEGYYLVREEVARKLGNGERNIEIAFVLPNDESKYYVDFPTDVEAMLQLDFGDQLNGVKVGITFEFFQYKDSLKARPYNEGKPMNPEEIEPYFQFLSRQTPVLRDIYHHDWTIKKSPIFP